MHSHGTCPYDNCSGPVVRTTLNNSRTYLCYACSRRPDLVSDDWQQPEHNPFKARTSGKSLADKLEDMNREEVNEVFGEV